MLSTPIVSEPPPQKISFYAPRCVNNNILVRLWYILETVEYSRNDGSHVVIQGPGKDSDQGSQETEAALTSLHALVLQLLVQHLHYGGHLRPQENYRTVDEECLRDKFTSLSLSLLTCQTPPWPLLLQWPVAAGRGVALLESCWGEPYKQWRCLPSHSPRALHKDTYMQFQIMWPHYTLVADLWTLLWVLEKLPYRSPRASRDGSQGQLPDTWQTHDEPSNSRRHHHCIHHLPHYDVGRRGGARGNEVKMGREQGEWSLLFKFICLHFIFILVLVWIVLVVWVMWQHPQWHIDNLGIITTILNPVSITILYINGYAYTKTQKAHLQYMYTTNPKPIGDPAASELHLYKHAKGRPTKFPR